MSVIIDAHCHAGEGDGFTGPWDTGAPLGRYLLRARRAGIGRTVLFPAFHTDYREANRRLATFIAGAPHRFFGFAFVHAARDRGRIADLVDEAVCHGFCGNTVHGHAARITREVCDVARRFSLPVLYDVAGEVSVVDLIAPAYPDVSFIIPHLGSFADEWKAQRAFLDPLARYPNVFTDTSGVRRFDLLAEAVQRAGARKILFGTDGPWLHPAIELAKVRELRLSGPEEADILGRNWLRLTARARARPRLRDWTNVSRIGAWESWESRPVAVSS